MPIVLVVHWSSYGGYHIARLNTAHDELEELGVTVVGLEISTYKNLFGWKPDERQAAFPRYVVFRGRTYESISPIAMFQGVMSALNRINPDVVAINGYSYFDAWSALVWCKMNRRPAILTCDSKSDDTQRKAWKEWIKRQIVKQYNSALCAGQCSRDYLMHLNIKQEYIFEGLDVIDNDFFWQVAETVRNNPNMHRSLPGLESVEPFFLASARLVKDKNIHGLLKAYARYRHQFCENGNRHIPWRLVILGDGVERNSLEQIVRSEEIEGVTFAGFRQIQELPIYLAFASVFIHPTLKDTWGLVVNEAMAVGLPVLVSNRAGCAPDLVHEGYNGFLFSPDDLDQLTKLMVLMSSEQVNLSSMGQASRELISEWGPKRFARGLGQALQTVIALDKLQ